MPRTAVARSPRHDSQSSMSGVDELIQRGRGQGYLSLPELRAAFGRAGVSAAEARSILRELADAGVRLGNDKPAAAKARAMRVGSAAAATAVLSSTASKPSSMAAAACEGAPMPASMMSGTAGKYCRSDLSA